MFLSDVCPHINACFTIAQSYETENDGDSFIDDQTSCYAPVSTCLKKVEKFMHTD